MFPNVFGFVLHERTRLDKFSPITHHGWPWVGRVREGGPGSEQWKIICLEIDEKLFGKSYERRVHNYFGVHCLCWWATVVSFSARLLCVKSSSNFVISQLLCKFHDFARSTFWLTVFRCSSTSRDGSVGQSNRGLRWDL